MVVSIMQPAYLPWLGYFHRIAVSDIHIVLDHVQFEKNSFTNRNKIRTKDGWCWLTVPVLTKGLFGHLEIYNLEISEEVRWRRKHWSTMSNNYVRASYFSEYGEIFRDGYNQPYEELSQVLKWFTAKMLELLEIRTEIVYSSALAVDGRKDELVLNLCREVGAKTYLSGPLGRNYLREEIFRGSGIQVQYHDYKHPVYGQVYPGFEPFMSAIDLLFNHGPVSRAILMRGQSEIKS